MHCVFYALVFFMHCGFFCALVHVYINQTWHKTTINYQGLYSRQLSSPMPWREQIFGKKIPYRYLKLLFYIRKSTLLMSDGGEWCKRANTLAMQIDNTWTWRVGRLLYLFTVECRYHQFLMEGQVAFIWSSRVLTLTVFKRNYNYCHKLISYSLETRPLIYPPGI